MDSSHLDQAEKSSPETSSDSSLSSDSPDNNGVFGDPIVHPRVGNEYQAEIPSLLREFELLRLMMNPADSKGIVDSSHSFLTGLPTPVMWVCNQANPIKIEKTEDHNKPNITIDAPGQTSVSKENWLVPGKPTESWSVFEADSFLVGLYLLGKNLLQVKRFVESKSMGEILAYYYGQFYASAGYSRWSECRKMRSRKCVIGHKFFTGHRQQELVSRLCPHVSEDTKAKLLEASSAYAEGRSSLDEYVFTLKALAGILALVNAIGVGKGKEDLTTLIFDGPKNNSTFSHRPEVPSGEAWSSLTCAGIVKYLTGDFRLSKARSSDLFWDAVWPRLLARGWHSEQPKGSNHLVFLTPGIKKFSRRKLSKGDHYFDSVSDVLAKVAGEPELLEIEADETTPSCSKGENGWAPEEKTDDDQDSSDSERHCYLKPRVSSGISDLSKFTIVDTSLASEDNPYKVMELRCLPAEAKRSLAISSRMRKTKNKLQVNGNVLPSDVQSSSFSANSKGLLSDNVGSQKIPNGNSSLVSLPINHKSRTIKHQFSRRVKSDGSGCVGSVSKRWRSSSGVDADTWVLSLPAKKNATLRIVGPKFGHSDAKLSSENPSEEVIHSEKGVSGNHVEFEGTPETEKLTEAPQSIDLNLPQVPTEPESGFKVKLEEEVSTSNQTSNVEKTKHFDSKKQKRYNFEKKRHPHSKIPTTSNANKPKKIVSEEKNRSEDTVYPSVKTESHVSSDKDVQSDQQPITSFVGKQKISEGTVCPTIKIEPQVSSTSGEPSHEAVQSDQQPTRHFVAEEHTISEDIKEPQVRFASGESPNKAVKLDQQPRRLSTRSRPLTTKALEALEIGLLSPVRTYRKRSPSVALDQKPKRARQSHNKSPMVPHDMVLEAGASKETCNGKTDTAE